MMVGIGVLCFFYAPLLYLLKSPPTKEEKKVSPEGVENVAMEAADDTHQELRISNENSTTKL